MEALFENNETDLSQYAFLKPTENLINIYASYPREYVKSIDENQFHNRMFFYNVEFDELETENIKSFRQYSDIQKADLPEYLDDSHILRFLYCCNFSYQKTLKKVSEHLLAIQTFVKKSNPKLNNLKEGLFYLYGRDKSLRPIIYIIFSKFLAKIKDKSFNEQEIIEDFIFLLECVKENMLVGGKIEKWVIFLDVKGLSLSIPLKIIQKIVGVMEDLYPLFLEKIYILNPSQVFQSIYKLAEKSFMKKTNADKIFVLRDINLKEFHEFIPLHQLPITYGGELPELEKYWPPVNTLDRFLSVKNREEEATDFNNAILNLSQQKKEKKSEKKRICEGLNCCRGSERKKEEIDKNKESCKLI